MSDIQKLLKKHEQLNQLDMVKVLSQLHRLLIQLSFVEFFQSCGDIRVQEPLLPLGKPLVKIILKEDMAKPVAGHPSPTGLHLFLLFHQPVPPL